MARGYPDYSPGAARSEQGEFLPTIAEPPIWLYDDFESPVNKWRIVWGSAVIESKSSGGDTSIGAFSGSGSLKITSGGVNVGSVQRQIGVIPISLRIGASCIFKMVEGAKFRDIYSSLTIIQVVFHTGTYKHRFDITYNYTDGKWYYRDGTLPSFIYLTTRNILEEYYHYVKVIVDPATQKYVSLQIDNEIIDMSGLPYEYSANVTPMRTWVYIGILAVPAQTAELYVDQYKITYGES